MIETRIATPADLAELDALFSRSYPRLLKRDYPPSVLVTALPLISRAQPRLLESRTYFVAHEAGRILGAGGWSRSAPHAHAGTEDVGHVRHVVTDDWELRRGVGRAVLARIVETARSAGLAGLHCMSTLTAEPFYRAMGFARLGPTTLSLGPGISFPAIAMERPL